MSPVTTAMTLDLAEVDNVGEVEDRLYSTDALPVARRGVVSDGNAILAGSITMRYSEMVGM